MTLLSHFSSKLDKQILKLEVKSIGGRIRYQLPAKLDVSNEPMLYEL